MAANDKHVYGFDFNDAKALVSGIARGSGQEVRLHKHPTNNAVKFFLGTLTTGWTGTTANVDLYDMANNSLGRNVEIEDPLGTFASLGVGDRIEVKQQGGVFYTNQAPCPA